MLTIDPKELNTKELHGYLMGSVGPRPIALASTIDENERPNLSPFSFFNIFSANPPIAIFSPSRRSRDNSTKHTLENASKTKEVVINLVSYNIVEQMSLSSADFSKGVNEFTKSGFTPVPSEKVKPFRVKESPVQLECVVQDIISMGNEGGAGNLVICEIVKIHISEHVLDTNKQIDPHKIDLVGRMGGNWYCRASGESIFKV
jgi:flavin reductase (DIM6/NTAB) family NADH-FMN oxidoreductase RutF